MDEMVSGRLATGDMKCSAIGLRHVTIAGQGWSSLPWRIFHGGPLSATTGRQMTVRASLGLKFAVRAVF
jgi:hypothetical protein